MTMERILILKKKRKFNKIIALLFSIACTLIVGCISFMSGNEKENKDRKENTFSFYRKFKWRQQLLLLYIGTFQLGKLLTSSFREGLKKLETLVFFGAQEGQRMNDSMPLHLPSGN